VARDGKESFDLVQKAQPALRAAMDRMVEIGMSEEQMRRLFESEVTRLRQERKE
jgi:hypothetical protein